nr:hypothetical protein Iba_chr06aCG13840 [Ipomoea batatas]GME01683.1 hypothetical protein Iba_contig2487CG0010 [Ipomoea batatas]
MKDKNCTREIDLPTTNLAEARWQAMTVSTMGGDGGREAMGGGGGRDCGRLVDLCCVDDGGEMRDLCCVVSSATVLMQCYVVSSSSRLLPCCVVY